jgi:hypothetical protein
MASGDELLIERLTDRASQLSAQSDTLDVKASILLVVVTFLAGQSADLLSKHHNGWVHWEQIVCIVLQIGAGVLLALQLRITSYDVELSETYPKWRDELSTYYANDAKKDENVLRDLQKGIIQRSVVRLEKTRKSNEQKATLVNLTFWVTLVSLACNLAALAPLLFSL